jgi:hypothetical protein
LAAVCLKADGNRRVFGQIPLTLERHLKNDDPAWSRGRFGSGASVAALFSESIVLMLILFLLTGLRS